MSRGDTRCIDGSLYRHDPQFDDPDLETNIGQCPECRGVGCEEASAESIEALHRPRVTRHVRYWVYSSFGDAIFSGPDCAEAVEYARAATGRTVEMVIETTSRSVLNID